MGRRQVSTVFALLPRGARKTTLASVLALGHTIGPEQRQGGQVIAAASDRTQARIAFDEARDMLHADERLVAATRIRDTKNWIEHRRSGSSYVAISAEGDAQHGKTPFLDKAGGYRTLTFAFLPETAFRRRCEELPDVPLRQWREDGHLTVIPGETRWSRLRWRPAGRADAAGGQRSAFDGADFDPKWCVAM